MGPQEKELVGVLDQLVALLEGEGEGHWSALIGNASQKIAGGDADGVDLLLGAFAGTDSFKGFALEKRDANRVLDNLRRRVHLLADFIKRS
jgi:hypothetical protein